MKQIKTFTNQLNMIVEYAISPAAIKHSGKPLIVYIHGGGLIYGNKDDLPKAYLKLLNDEGFSVLSIDYPLIPETDIKNTLKSLELGITTAIEELQLENKSIILFGRSAGAYLSLLLSQSELKNNIVGLISFYGYYSILDNRLNKPSTYYNKYPIINETMVQPLIKDRPLSNSTIEQRFPLYLSYRQSGLWVKKMLGSQLLAKDYSLNIDELKSLPPIFIAASNNDQDVPYEISKELATYASNSTFFKVTGSPHDFDRDTIDPQAIEAYNHLLKWLKQFK